MHAIPHTAAPLRILRLFAAILIPSALPVLAGHYTTAIVKDFTGPRPVAYQARIVFDADRLHVDTTGFSGTEGQTELIYRTDLRKIWQVDHADKSYVEIDEKLMGSVGNGMSAAIGAVEELLRQQGVPIARDAEVAIEATGRVKELWGLSCDGYVIRQGETKLQEVWLASWAASGITMEHFGAVRQLASSSDKILATFAGSALMQGVPYIPLAQVAGLDGYPVQIRQFGQGKVVYDIFLQPPSPTDGEDVRFDIVPGYRRRLM